MTRMVLNCTMKMSSMAAVGEFGIYPLSENDLKDIAKKI